MPLTTTTITDTLYNIDGTLFTGKLRISAQPLPGMTSEGTASLSARPVDVTVSGGSLSVTLAPNDAANPPNSYYLVRFYPDSGAQWTEKWFVPSQTPVTLEDVRMNEYGRTRLFNFDAADSVTIPGPRFNFGSKIPLPLLFDADDNEYFAGPITRVSTSGDIIIESGGTGLPSGYAQLLVTANQYQKSLVAATGVITIDRSEFGFGAVEGVFGLDTSGSPQKYVLTGWTLDGAFNMRLKSVSIDLGSVPFTGKLIVYG